MPDFKLSGKKSERKNFTIGSPSGESRTVELNAFDPWTQINLGKLLGRYNRALAIGGEDSDIASVELISEMWPLAIKDWIKHESWFKENVTDINDWTLLFTQILDEMSIVVTSQTAKKKRKKKRKKQKQQF